MTKNEAIWGLRQYLVQRSKPTSHWPPEEIMRYGCQKHVVSDLINRIQKSNKDPSFVVRNLYSEIREFSNLAQENFPCVKTIQMYELCELVISDLIAFYF